MRIMVVDDELDVTDLFKQRFRKEMQANRVEFIFQHSAEEALETLTNNGSMDVVLILSDINMPGMNGLELLHILKTTNPTIKVIMVTAYNDDENFSQAMKYGADGFINKPIDFTTLKEQIMSISGDKRG